jgi:formylglycine-generating enzyme required for sulfatase activity
MIIRKLIVATLVVASLSAVPAAELTKDLESMAKVGIKRAMIGNITLNKKPKRPKMKPGKAKRFYPPKSSFKTGNIWTKGKGSPKSLELAIRDLMESFGDQYPNGASYLTQLESIQMETEAGQAAFDALFSKALLENPLLDSNSLLMISRKRGKMNSTLSNVWGFPRSSQGNSAILEQPWESELLELFPVAPDGKLKTLFKPARKELVDNLLMHWDGDRYLFSTPDSNDCWQVFEGYLDGRAPKQLTPSEAPIDNYDACYLPDGDILYCSTAPAQMVPCNVNGLVGVLFRMSMDGSNRHQLTFDQDTNHAPKVMRNGLIMYGRWEYTDLAHYFSRLVFQMYPDGTGQRAIYGSNSYWPNCYWGNTEIPGKPGQFVSVISGHHMGFRSGEMILFDTGKARAGAAGVIQRIPGRNEEVKEVISDALTVHSIPKFQAPVPLYTDDPRLEKKVNGKYFIASAMMEKNGNYGIYLVDVFDNMVPIFLSDDKSKSYFFPTPVRKSKTPPVLPSRINPDDQEATVMISDIYYGPGLKGVPRGTVKNLRLFSYYYSLPRTAGVLVQGVDSGWEGKRILGTVPVEADGSAFFKMPANLPISIQPLDEDGRAIQLMRSWTVGMPGEQVACIGCHESMNDAPPQIRPQALNRAPSPIEPWYGQPRPFNFRNEVQPVLNKYCVSCHDGQNTKPSFIDHENEAYHALHPFVRRYGPESDYVLLDPAAFHSSTSELVQILKRGHHNVKLNEEAWQRLYAWIDLNAPLHGNWLFANRVKDNKADYAQRMNQECKNLNTQIDPEAEFQVARAAYEASRSIKPVIPIPLKKPEPIHVAGWPFDASKEPLKEQTLQMGNQTLQLVRIPDGSFPRGSIDQPFWMCTTEVSNELYAQFDPAHDSRYFDMISSDHNTRGYPGNEPQQPVIRVSAADAKRFCQWLSKKTGKNVSLPTETQWEWAAKAGSNEEFAYGDAKADFSAHANLADYSIKNLSMRGFRLVVEDWPGAFYNFVPREPKFDDGWLVTAPVGSLKPNPWGLHDMHGNVWEWTREKTKTGETIAKGGSWRDRPKRAGSSLSVSYPDWQQVYNVGFRIIIEE